MKSVLDALLAKTARPDGTCHVALVNLTPYDGAVERVARKWADGNTSFKCLSVSKHFALAQYVEKNVAMDLMEECWVFPSKSF